MNDFVAAGYLRDVAAFHLDVDIHWFESNLPGWNCRSACALSTGVSQRKLPPVPDALWSLPS